MRAALTSAALAVALACGRADAPRSAAPPAAPPSQPPRSSPAADTVPPAGPAGVAVRRGRALLAATRDSLPSHVGNSLRCFSCHLDEGRRATALPLVGSYVHYPQFRARGARVDLIEDRVNDCFVRSLNGHPLVATGEDMRDIVAYLAWLSRNVAARDTVRAAGIRDACARAVRLTRQGLRARFTGAAAVARAAHLIATRARLAVDVGRASATHDALFRLGRCTRAATHGSGAARLSLTSGDGSGASVRLGAISCRRPAARCCSVARRAAFAFRKLMRIDAARRTHESYGAQPEPRPP